MKKIKKCLQFCAIFALMIGVLPICAAAEGEDVDRLLDDYREIVPGELSELELDDVVSLLGPDALLSELLSALRGEGGRLLSFLLLLVGVSVLISVVRVLPEGVGSAVRPAVSALGSFLILSSVLPLAGEVASALSAVSSFFAALIPIGAGVLALEGSVLASSTSSVGMALTLEVCSLFTERFLLLLVFCMFVAGAARSFGGPAARLLGSIRTVFTRGLTLLSTVFVGLLSMQTLISGVGDNMTMRAARWAAGSMIPMVGGTVAGTLSSVMGGAAYAKGLIGGSAVAVIVALAASPLVLLLGYKLCFFIAESLLSFSDGAEGSAAVGGLRDALDCLIAVYVISVMLYLIEIAVMLAVGGGG